MQCPECKHVMAYVPRWDWWECSCGSVVFLRAIRLPPAYQIEPLPGPWSVIAFVKLKGEKDAE